MPLRHKDTKKKKKKCFLCGSNKDLTREHIPPKNLFRPPLPTDLITVPSCKKCNKSYDLDDEYFRVFVAGQGYNDEIGKWIWGHKVINSSLKRSPALNAELVKNITPIDSYSSGGIYLGKKEGIFFEVNRVNRIIEKICRGLFTHHHPEIDISGMNCDINRINIDKEKLQILSSLKRESIGGDTFIYWRGFDNQGSCKSFWAFLFYTSTMFIVSTNPI